MALKFLNKKGWHTGSLRNIENVWKAEQKHEAEQKKLEELRKQIQDEREQSEFRQLQEQAGLIPKQERLEFLYDSGLAVGKGSSDSFALGKPGEPQKIETENELNQLAAVPGALFVVEKSASANDTWRKLHTDPLLMIRQREQEALSQIRNNPVKMEMIKKSLDVKKLRKEEKERKKAEKKNRKKEKHKRKPSSDSESDMDTTNRLRKAEKKKRKKEKQKRETSSDSDSDMDATTRLKKTQHKYTSHKQSIGSDSENKLLKGISNEEDMKIKRNHLMEPMERYNSNIKIPEDREHLKNSEKQQERRCHQEKPRSPSNYRHHRGQSPSENGERHRSRSPNHGKILSHRSRYRSRSPSDYGERHRSRSPLDHVKSQHLTQRHGSRSPSDYGRRHRSPLKDGGRHRSPSGYVGRQRSPLQDSGRHRSPSDSGRRHRPPLQDSVRYRPPLQDSVRYRAHSPDGWRNKLPSNHRNKIVSQQDRVNDLHARGTDSQSAEEKPSTVPDHTKPASRPKYQAGKLSEEEKAARLREMQMDAELHDEQRWQRLKKASEADAREAIEAARGSGKNFLDVTNKRVYGADKGGSSTIEESVRRRTHYLQGSANATEGNAFRR